MDDQAPSSAALAQGLIDAGGPATLATLTSGGAPFASFVVIAPVADGALGMLLSDLAEHTKNLKRDPRASLLFTREPEPGSETMMTVRLTLTGDCMKDDDPAKRRRYVERHPDAARYANFSDFALYRFDIASGHLVAGFGRIVSLTRDELVPPSLLS